MQNISRPELRSGTDTERFNAKGNTHGLGRLIRSLVGLDQQAASQIHFVNLIIAHLTRHGEMDPGLL